MPTTEQATKKKFEPIKLSQARYQELCDESAGYCVACREEAYGVEPDARRYECDACGERKVYGIEELCLMGAIEFTEGED